MGGAEEKKRPLLCGALPQPKVVFYMQSARVSLISPCGRITELISDHSGLVTEKCLLSFLPNQKIGKFSHTLLKKKNLPRRQIKYILLFTASLLVLMVFFFIVSQTFMGVFFLFSIIKQYEVILSGLIAFRNVYSLRCENVH